MIHEFTVENFKSIENLVLPMGRVTVLIGENGAGKSNLLEAMAYFSAATHNKLDSEFLYARGVRNCVITSILSAFGTQPEYFRVCARTDKKNETCDLVFSLSDKEPFLEWVVGDGTQRHLSKQDGVWSLRFSVEQLSQIEKAAKAIKKDSTLLSGDGLEERVVKILLPVIAKNSLKHKQMLAKGLKMSGGPFVIFSPENTALRTFESEGQMRPLGVRGEGLFKLVQQFAEYHSDKFKTLRHELKLFDWFEDFAIPKRLGMGESRIDIKDRFLAAKRLLDQRSANEGFLFLLFYLCLFLSPQTPKFFAIDNIDASLNPKLCAEMMRRLVALAKQEDKQVVITTHNPAILDGLDLNDKEQLLYAIQRDEKGRTIAQRIPAPKPKPGEPALKLSHAYLRGLLGGVPKNF